MKKLMIAAAIVCAAAFAQAATIAWQLSGVTDAPGAAEGVADGNYYVYTFLVADSTATPETPGLNNTYTLEQVLAAFQGGMFPEVDLDPNIGMDSILADGSAMPTLEGLDVTGASESSPITLTAMSVIFDSWNSDPTDDSAPVWSKYQVLTKEFEFAEDTTLPGSSTAANDWQAVPEPTTGLLMLLGMGALALRRRRA